ncbi:uncharacterized protein (DUF58 family) [Cytobacillus eiseniae]|uniref:Uncharacterized protein (DUF58 family) n=1 Tax=Cytobacillus eiseniae TaxID=762947 RepID=A0ABS4RFS4_9BACI|nr:DUF58 domain-containing protein [Cytobacillus eiseniae]MBP2241749.1 uncharacterized protein (DUF58 family) [Cytobacillus eiseniae]
MNRLITATRKVWKLIVLLLLIVITFSYAMFQGGFVSWFLFYSFLPFSLYALFLSFYSMNQFEVKRTFHKNEFIAGESLKVTITLKRRVAFPLFYLIVEDCINNQLFFSQQGNRSKSFVFPGFQKEFTWSYEVEKLPRGEHFFQAIRLRTGDLLGLIEKENYIQLEDKMLVYPSYENLIYKTMENQYDQGMTASRERVQRDTSMAIGIREYQPGDRFSWINWKATAKRNEMMTKDFEQRQSHNVYILMDCAPDRRFEAIVSFSASIIKAILLKGAHVGFLSSASERTAFPVRGGESQQQQLFYHLAKIKDNSEVSLDRVLKVENPSLSQSNNLMLVTSQLTRSLIEVAGRFTANSAAITLFLIKSEKETISQQELALKEAARTRGIRVVFVHDGHFLSVFSEVAIR